MVSITAASPPCPTAAAFPTCQTCQCDSAAGATAMCFMQRVLRVRGCDTGWQSYLKSVVLACTGLKHTTCTSRNPFQLALWAHLRGLNCCREPNHRVNAPQPAHLQAQSLQAPGRLIPTHRLNQPAHSMGRPFRVLLDGKVYACGNCRTHLASSYELVSKHFHSKSGRAYLFHTACNVVGGNHEHRMMTTGKHIVCDIYCMECMSCVGWQYIFAFEESQKYKEGMCILERAMVVDFDKTSPAASLARASSNSSGSSGTSSQGPNSMDYQATGVVLYAADDSGSEEDE